MRRVGLVGGGSLLGTYNSVGGGVPNQLESQKLNNSALQMLGKTTCSVSNTGGGTLACAFVVNSIVDNALGKPITGATNNTSSFGRSTSQMKIDLDVSSLFYLVGTNINAIRPGDIIISPTTGNVTGHVGIYTNTGKIISNSSSRTIVDDHFTPNSWINYYTNNKGLTTYIYRAGS
jgi:cell wall-associated NlpC family hydrolase